MVWNNLEYWKTGEWQVVMERLDDLRKSGRQYNPSRAKLFEALRVCPYDSCRVAIIGQDPYPDERYATGIAFDVGEAKPPYPASLCNIFNELSSDLDIPVPSSGNLRPWCDQGVLLWNAYPSCLKGKPGSHHWCEWEYLTREILEKLDGKAVIVALGSIARSFLDVVHESPILSTSHPSPLGVKHGFEGSRIFSRINALLEKPIDWRL